MSALGSIYAALKTTLAADVGVTTLLAAGTFKGTNGKAVYDEGETQSASLPLVTVGAGTEIPWGPLGTRGWNCTVQLKAIVQGTEAEGQAIVRALSALLFRLPPVYLTVAGFSSCCISEFVTQPTLIETVAGVQTRSCPVILRMYTS